MFSSATMLSELRLNVLLFVIGLAELNVTLPLHTVSSVTAPVGETRCDACIPTTLKSIAVLLP